MECGVAGARIELAAMNLTALLPCSHLPSALSSVAINIRCERCQVDIYHILNAEVVVVHGTVAVGYELLENGCAFARNVLFGLHEK